MSELRIGTSNSEPATGTLKIGSTDVQEIYLGSTKIWPSTPPLPCDPVQIGNLIWTTCNSSITSSSQGSIPILTTNQEVSDADANSTAGAVYYDFNSANAQKGLMYNKYAAATITPPSGFRLPTDADWDNLASELDNISGTTDDVTAGGGGTNALWNSNIKANADYGLSGFDSIRAGYALYSGGLNFSTSLEAWWKEEGLASPNPVGAVFIDRSTYIEYRGIQGGISYWYIRFCKDA
jgi:uncharacterized protein (TIGR02145 family)